jgi:hypothetical protein
MITGDTQLREFAAAAFTEAFGEPERFRSVDGTLYRWMVKHPGRTIRITLDSPEFPDLAHFLISDTKAQLRVAAETCRTRDDVLALLERLREPV